MSDPSVEALREQLRDRGYLRHGIERWFALDPWRSRAFWVELAIVALKAATLIAAFAALPHTAVMLMRNSQLNALDTLLLFALYGCTWLVVSFALVVVAALLLKVRPEVALDTPRALLGISIAAAALLTALFAIWWYRFETPPSMLELAVGGTLAALLLVVATIVVSAALLSFSIHELHRIPAIHQRSRTFPLLVAALALMAVLFVPVYLRTESEAQPPAQVVTKPGARRSALIGVDGLTWEIARSRPDLLAAFTAAHPAAPIAGASAAERWASLGSGVPANLHGVRAVAGVRMAAGGEVLQSISRSDFVLHRLAPAIGLARRQPLPPTVRRRDFIWEILAARGVQSLAVNWWTSPTVRAGALTSVGQEAIFAASRGNAIRLDTTATENLMGEIGETEPRLATLYLPGLDVILNRSRTDPSARLAASIRALDGIVAAVTTLKERGFDVILAGLPGEGQTGEAIIATTFPMARPGSAWDVAPTVASLFGFPASAEMPGRSLAGTEEPRIATYGHRVRGESPPRLNQEYYDSLKALGYIQ